MWKTLSMLVWQRQSLQEHVQQHAMSLQKAKKKKSSYKIAFSDSENDDDNAKGKAEETTVEMDDLEDSVEEDEGVKRHVTRAWR